jgi:hypothetical protein
MKITCTATFLDGRDRFEAGETLATESGQACRVITDEQAARFVANGWASNGPTQLAIADSLIGQEASHG